MKKAIAYSGFQVASIARDDTETLFDRSIYRKACNRRWLLCVKELLKECQTLTRSDAADALGCLGELIAALPSAGFTFDYLAFSKFDFAAWRRSQPSLAEAAETRRLMTRK